MSKYKVGDTGKFSKTISEADVYLFAGICGDFNPVHVNKVEAEKSKFNGQIAHGALVSSFISTVLGMYMPGPGTIYMEQKSIFVKPVYIGDTITAEVTINNINEKGIADLSTKVVNQMNSVVIEGYAKVMLPKG